MSSTIHPTPSALLLAAAASVDPRTAQRAIDLGPSAIRGAVVRARVADAMSALGLAPATEDRSSVEATETER